MMNFQTIPPMTESEQLASTLSAAAARQPNMPLVRAAVANRYPHLAEAEQDALAEQVAADMRRSILTIGYPEHTITVPAPQAVAAAVPVIHQSWGSA